jgi:hypothetical protein
MVTAISTARSVCAVVAAVLLSAVAASPASAAPLLPRPLEALLGQECSDVAKLDYDPAVGQIACDGSNWVRSATPTGVRNIGAPCTAAEMDSLMASSTDGHLIWCPHRSGVWILYRP